MPAPLDRFLPHPDVRERHDVLGRRGLSEVAGALAADADAGDVEPLVGGGREQDARRPQKPGADRGPGDSGGLLEETAAGRAGITLHGTLLCQETSTRNIRAVPFAGGYEKCAPGPVLRVARPSSSLVER